MTVDLTVVTLSPLNMCWNVLFSLPGSSQPQSIFLFPKHERDGMNP